MTMAVSCRSLSVARGGRDALAGVDLDIPAGRLVGVIGPSGGGKSTLLRSIVGVQANVEGSLEVLGRPAAVAARAGLVGYATQEVSVYDDLTATENLSYVGRLLGVDGARPAELLRVLQLTDVAQRRVADLSGGQRARVSLAIALLAAPPLLVLDEPTVGLDPVLRRELWDWFASLAATGTTLLVSSHVMDEAERCEWLVLLRAGRLLAAGPRGDLLERTGTSRVEDAFLALVGEQSA